MPWKIVAVPSILTNVESVRIFEASSACVGDVLFANEFLTIYLVNLAYVYPRARHNPAANGSPIDIQISWIVACLLQLACSK